MMPLFLDIIMSLGGRKNGGGEGGGGFGTDHLRQLATSHMPAMAALSPYLPVVRQSWRILMEVLRLSIDEKESLIHTATQVGIHLSSGGCN